MKFFARDMVKKRWKKKGGGDMAEWLSLWGCWIDSQSNSNLPPLRTQNKISKFIRWGEGLGGGGGKYPWGAERNLYYSGEKSS